MTRVAVASGRGASLASSGLDALVLPLFRARVQPRGVAGHADWRLGGRIGHLLRTQRLLGEADEALLMPTGGRIGFARVFVFGLGTVLSPQSGQTHDRLAAIAEALAEAGAQQHAIGFPVVPGARPDVEQEGVVDWAEAWLTAVAPQRARLEEVVLLDEDGRLEAALPRLRARAGDLGLTWSA